jgi:excisionase family DNA binding protein
MKTQSEREDIEAIAQRVVELLKPYLLGREETKVPPDLSKLSGHFMTISQLAEYLKISKSTIYIWIYKGKIPYAKVGKMVRFKTEDIEQWSEKRKVKASYDERLR